MQKLSNKEITKSSFEKINELLNSVQNMEEEEYKNMLRKFSLFHTYSLKNQAIL